MSAQRSVLASHHPESEGRRIREIILFSLRARGKKKEGFRKIKKRKKPGGSGFRRQNDARERVIAYRSGAIDDERLDFLRSFLCCWGHV